MPARLSSDYTKNCTFVTASNVVALLLLLASSVVVTILLSRNHDIVESNRILPGQNGRFEVIDESLQPSLI
jgi:hypothetical protein